MPLGSGTITFRKIPHSIGGPASRQYGNKPDQNCTSFQPGPQVTCRIISRFMIGAYLARFLCRRGSGM